MTITSPTPRTFTTQGVERLSQLDALDDLICGMYGQDFFLVEELTEDQRKYLYLYLDEVLQFLRDWRLRWHEGVSDDDLDRVARILPALKRNRDDQPTVEGHEHD